MTLDNDEDLQALKEIGGIVARCLRLMGEALESGMTTLELDQMGEKYLEAHGAQSAPRAMYDFPGATCISVNEEVAHGIPGERRIGATDLVHVDVSAVKDGYYGDCGASFAMDPNNDLDRRICQATRKALREAMRKARAGRPIRGVGKAMETVARRSGFGVIRNLGSHGLGRSLHEEPTFVPGFDDKNESRKFTDGMVLTLEPFLTTGNQQAETADDGWTLCNREGSRTAQFEHTIVVTKSQPIVLTNPR